MIKFFRKIRQNLLSEGKTRNYLKYAIGELILVVVGILIALSINNWNQNRTFKKELHQIIKEVHTDLNQDLLYLDKEINEINRYNKNIDNLLNNGTKMPADSLLKNISAVHTVTSFAPVNFGYNKLNKHPRTDLLPDSLSDNLTIYYSKYANQMGNVSFEGLSKYSIDKFRDYLIRYGFPLETRDLEKPQDLTVLEFIIRDVEFIGILRNTKFNRTIQLSGLIEARKQAENCLKITNHFLTAMSRNETQGNNSGK